MLVLIVFLIIMHTILEQFIVSALVRQRGGMHLYRRMVDSDLSQNQKTEFEPFVLMTFERIQYDREPFFLIVKCQVRAREDSLIENI